MKHRIVIVGATGRVGEAFFNIASTEADCEILALGRREANFLLYKGKYHQIDILEKKSLKRAIYDFRPTAIINCAAMTNVDLCESEKTECRKLNTTLVETLTNISKVTEAQFITISTDYIFDGVSGPYSETAKPSPLNYYGKTKLAAENYALNNHDKSCVVRTNVVYGKATFAKTDFIDWVINSLKNGSEIRVVDGQYCNPTLNVDIARGLLKLIEKNRIGIFNFAGPDYLSRYEIAVAIANALRLPQELIIKIAPEELKQSAKRPERGGLINLKAETDLNIKFTPLDAALLQNKLISAESM
ncbi:MAG: SDR family oxidoreductase [Chloroflexota bacterium]